MADEVTPLVSFFNASKNIVALSHFTRCRSSCVQSKGAIVAIVWSVLLVTALGTTVMLSNQFPTIFFNLFPVTYVIMVVLYLVMILPQFLSGISSIVVTVTGFEFILAQGPRNMQGLLIGLWICGR